MLTTNQLKQVLVCASERLTLPKDIVLRLGKFDNAGRYYIHSAAHTDSSRKVRSPSRAWPYSEYKHAFTVVYARQLAMLINFEA